MLLKLFVFDIVVWEFKFASSGFETKSILNCFKLVIVEFIFHMIQFPLQDRILIILILQFSLNERSVKVNLLRSNLDLQNLVPGFELF